MRERESPGGSAASRGGVGPPGLSDSRSNASGRPKRRIIAGGHRVWPLAALCVGFPLLVVGCATLHRIGPPDPSFEIEISSAKVERGAYLVRHVAVCLDCHSKRRWDLYSAPPVAGQEGAGGVDAAEIAGIRAVLPAPNITPFGVGFWSDSELIRAITEGVDREGRALATLMPYPSYAFLTQADSEAIIAYLRSLPPVESVGPTRKISRLQRLFFWSMPRTARPTELDPRSSSVERGRYLAQIAGCYDCHTPRRRGRPLESRAFEGGNRFYVPGSGVSVTAPGIGPHWEYETPGRDAFIGRFKAFAHEPETFRVQHGEPTTVMPWLQFAGMTTEDLGAIYDFLDSLGSDPGRNRQASERRAGG